MPKYKSSVYFFVIGFLSTTLLQTMYLLSSEKFGIAIRAAFSRNRSSTTDPQQELQDIYFQFQMRDIFINIAWLGLIIAMAFILTRKTEARNIRDIGFLKDRFINFLLFLIGYLMVVTIVIVTSMSSDAQSANDMNANFLTLFDLIKFENPPLINTEDPYRLFIINLLQGVIASMMPIFVWISFLFINENSSEKPSNDDSVLYPNELNK
ncbi:MAG: hypothetical protein ACC656_09285 [Candidatus Heimdallarchaeota archaeon]